MAIVNPFRYTGPVSIDDSDRSDDTETNDLLRIAARRQQRQPLSPRASSARRTRSPRSAGEASWPMGPGIVLAGLRGVGKTVLNEIAARADEVAGHCAVRGRPAVQRRFFEPRISARASPSARNTVRDSSEGSRARSGASRASSIASTLAAVPSQRLELDVTANRRAQRRPSSSGFALARTSATSARSGIGC